MAERWLPIVGWPGYQVSNLGNVLGRYGKVLHPSRRQTGYLTVQLFDGDGHSRSRRVHRLVLETFLGPCPDGCEARHLDDNPGNNSVTNLVWATHSENVFDQVTRGTHNMSSKTRCREGHEYSPDNTRYENGGRVCRKCRAAAIKRWRERGSQKISDTC